MDGSGTNILGLSSNEKLNRRHNMELSADPGEGL